MKMRDKRTVQIEAKQKHNEELKAAQARRRSEPLLERTEPTKLEKPTILIVCEGKNTEPSYFKQFKLSSAKIKALGDGRNTISLVKQAIVLNEQDSYDQVWCVFDKDEFDADDFNAAVQMAAKNNFGAAYSNQAFEYWLILHFEDHQGGAMHSSEYETTINGYINPLGSSYEGSGNKIVTQDFFDILNDIDQKTNQSRAILAIQRAKRNFNRSHQGNPAAEESSTTVFRLVEEIMKFI